MFIRARNRIDKRALRVAASKTAIRYVRQATIVRIQPLFGGVNTVDLILRAV